MKAWFLGLGVISAAVSLAVGPHTASAVDQLGGAFTQIAVAHSAWARSSSTDAAARYLFEKDKAARAPATGSAVARGRLCSPPASRSQRPESRLPWSAPSEGQTGAFR